MGSSGILPNPFPWQYTHPLCPLHTNHPSQTERTTAALLHRPVRQTLSEATGICTSAVAVPPTCALTNTPHFLDLRRTNSSTPASRSCPRKCKMMRQPAAQNAATSRRVFALVLVQGRKSPSGCWPATSDTPSLHTMSRSDQHVRCMPPVRALCKQVEGTLLSIFLFFWELTGVRRCDHRS